MRYLLFVAVFIVWAGTKGQDLTTKSKKAIALYVEADNYRVRRQYNAALDLLYQAVKKDKNFAEAYFRMGLVYKDMGNQEEAKKFFQRAHDLFPTEKIYPMVYFELASMFMAEEDYVKAEEQVNLFLGTNPRDNMALLVAKKIQIDSHYGQKNKKPDTRIDPQPLSTTVNAFPIQYFPVITADGKTLIYTARGQQTDEELVVSTRESPDKEWGRPESISRNINTRANEGTCAISGDGQTLIFTSCQGRPGFGSCDLFVSYKVGGEWQLPENMGPLVNSADWDSQPSLSADGQTLYFVSNRHGGLGNRDLWMTTRDDQGAWTKAVNMGNGINTPFNEISPFIHANNRTLYFASDGYPGFGGIDIFISEREGDKWSFPENFGYSINNSKDQVSLFISSDGSTGYYSEEKGVGAGFYSRLLEFDVPADRVVSHKTNYVTGTITDADTGRPLGSSVELFDIANNKRMARVASDSVNGRYLMVLTEGSEYALYINKKGYLFHSLSFDFNEAEYTEPLNIDVALKPVKKGASVALNNIFFDIGSYTLRDKSVTELERVVRFMKENPTTRIEIGGHTDNTGAKKDNQVLSENRAKSVYQYLVEHGVGKDRVGYKGHGDSQPAVPNDSEENRQRNRRIEFNVL